MLEKNVENLETWDKGASDLFKAIYYAQLGSKQKQTMLFIRRCAKAHNDECCTQNACSAKEAWTKFKKNLAKAAKCDIKATEIIAAVVQIRSQAEANPDLELTDFDTDKWKTTASQMGKLADPAKLYRHESDTGLDDSNLDNIKTNIELLARALSYHGSKNKFLEDLLKCHGLDERCSLEESCKVLGWQEKFLPALKTVVDSEQSSNGLGNQNSSEFIMSKNERSQKETTHSQLDDQRADHNKAKTPTESIASKRQLIDSINANKPKPLDESPTDQSRANQPEKTIISCLLVLVSFMFSSRGPCL